MISGDYSDSQLMRVNRQALTLHRYYELLENALTTYQSTGQHFLVLPLVAQAARVLGEDRVAPSTVRLWHADYVEGDGVLRADERGHYSRDLLVMEEDVKSKFVKWSLSKAKHDDLSVEAAQEYLNNELLSSLEAKSTRPHPPPAAHSPKVLVRVHCAS